MEEPGEFKPGAGYTSIRAVVNYQMGTLKNAITSYNVNVYNADPTTGNTLGGNWYDSPFGGGLVVELTGSYQFFLPSFLYVSSSIPITIKSMMTSEAN